MENIYVTRPSLPNLEEFIQHLKKIWDSGIVTNNGPYHQSFEKKLRDYLNVTECTLINNGTMGLILALQALRISGEVITTPYSFVATTHALSWNGIKPVFCDIEENGFNMDPKKIEKLITPNTTAILPVHVYGNACKTEEIQEIANKYGLKVIYDAAHAFGIKKENGDSILDDGDLSILSFHATKVFNTIEGGAIITKDKRLKERLDHLRNFGFENETNVVGLGINAKMNELQAALGILQLQTIDIEISKRKQIYLTYLQGLFGITGLKTFQITDSSNYGYFPILIDKEAKCSRDELYFKLREKNIYSRRYFYPLISNFPIYHGLPSSQISNLPNAHKTSTQILCLPIYSEITNQIQKFIIDEINTILRD